MIRHSFAVCRTYRQKVPFSHTLLEDQEKSPNRVNGTLGIYGAASSIDFVPEEMIAALRHYYLGLLLWNNLFGFPDSYHLNLAQLLASEDQDPNDEIDPGILE